MRELIGKTLAGAHARAAHAECVWFGSRQMNGASTPTLRCGKHGVLRLWCVRMVPLTRDTMLSVTSVPA